MIAIDILTF